MVMVNPNPPAIISFNHFDPSGYSGIQADIETSIGLGCHCTPIITALCTGDTHDIVRYTTIEAKVLIEQTEKLFADFSINAIHIGSLGNTETAQAICAIVAKHPSIPVVLNAISAAHPFTKRNSHIAAIIENHLLPLAKVVIIDYQEVKLLSVCGDSDDAYAASLMAVGCGYLLVQNISKNKFTLYDEHGLNHEYNCATLGTDDDIIRAHIACSISTYLAHQLPISDSIQQGLRFAQKAYHAARPIGQGKAIHHRLFWAEK